MKYMLAIASVVAAALCITALPIFFERGATSEPCVTYVQTGEAEHIFTHELVYDMKKACKKRDAVRDCFDRDHLTSVEFIRLLERLYENGYALLSLEKSLEGVPEDFPTDKRPLVMSFDDMTYDTVDRGCVDKLVLKDGEIYDYTQTDGTYSRERENIPLLEKFIDSHPDFSPLGDRAALCVNGYNGVFGYRVTPDCKVSAARLERDTAELKELVKELKDCGYTFASHTYYHSYFDSSSSYQIEKDCAAWQKYIEPIVGKTRVLCYPAGRHKAKSVKNDIFKKYGFDVFLCVGSCVPTSAERSESGVRYIYRKPFDGTALRLYGKLYAHLCDTRAVYDETRFRPFSYKKGY